MSCMACEVSTKLKANGIEAECILESCQMLKGEPSYSMYRTRDSFKKPKEKMARKEQLFQHIPNLRSSPPKIKIDIQEDGTLLDSSLSKKNDKPTWDDLEDSPIGLSVKKEKPVIVKKEKPVFDINKYLPDFLQ